MAYKSDGGPKGGQTAGGRAAGDVGGRGGMGGQSGNRGGGDRSGGSTAKRAGNATVADQMVATGRISAPSIPSGGVAKGNYNSQVDAYNDYAKAVGEYDTRGMFGRVMDFIGGPLFDQQEPMAGNPRSFAGGSFHSTTNPGGVLGALAPYGVGNVLGPLASKAYAGLGLPQAWHGGYDQPDMRNGVFGNTQNAMGGTLADAADRVNGGGFGPGGAPNMAGGGTGQGGQFAQASNSMFMPRSPSAPSAPSAPGAASQFGFSTAPQAMFGTGGKYGGSSFRPGYSFLTPGSY